MADFFLRPPTLTARDFEVLLSTDLIFTVVKDLNLLKKHTKNQEASCNFRLGFALSYRPHFHSAFYLNAILYKGTTKGCAGAQHKSLDSSVS